MPLVSVIIPTYNRCAMLEKAVQSVLSQNFRNFELIVVDDGSKDQTKKIMQKYTSVRYFYKQNGGVASARNFGIKKAEGDLIAWLDDDDYFLPEKLQKQVDFFKKNPRIGLVYTGHSMVDSTATQVKKTYFVPPHIKNLETTRKLLLRQCFFANSTVMMKKECFERTGLFDEGLSHTVDYDMWLRTAAFYKFGCVPQVLTVYCWHGRQISVRRDARVLPELRKKARDLYEKHSCGEVE